MTTPRIKKQIVKVQVKPSPSGYPCVMQHKSNSGLIVLFKRYAYGIVLKADSTHSFGNISLNWAMTTFIPFHGRVILDIEKPVSPNSTMLNEVEK